MTRVDRSGAGGTQPDRTEVNVAFERALELTRAIEDRCAAETRRLDWGVQLTYPDLPLVWALNFVRAEALPDEMDAPELAAAVEALTWPSPESARRVVVEHEATGRRLAPGFPALGWEVERLAYMALAGPAPEPGPIPVVEISSEERARAMVEFLAQTDKPVTALEQLIESRKVVERAVSVQRFGAYARSGPAWRDAEADGPARRDAEADGPARRDAEADGPARRDAGANGRLASCCELFTNGSTAQVENVQTALPYRRRGLATAVTLAAVHAALAAGCDLVFLIADADDWPKEMYRKLGFAEIGTTYEMRRVPTA